MISSFFFFLLRRCLEGQISNSRRSSVPSVCSTNSSWTSPPSSSSELTWCCCTVSTYKKKRSCNYAIRNHYSNGNKYKSDREFWGKTGDRWAHLSLPPSLLGKSSSQFFSKLFSMDLGQQTGLRLSLDRDKKQTVFIALWLKVNKEITRYYSAHHKYGRWRACRAPSALLDRLPCEWGKGPSVSWHPFCPADRRGRWRRWFYCSLVLVQTLRRLPADVQPIFPEDPEYPVQRFCWCLDVSSNYWVLNSQFTQKRETEDTF